MLKHTKMAFQVGVQLSSRLYINRHFTLVLIHIIATLRSGRKNTVKKALNHAVRLLHILM